MLVISMCHSAPSFQSVEIKSGDSTISGVSPGMCEHLMHPGGNSGMALLGR